MGITLHAHWGLRVIQPVRAPIQAVYKNLEVNLVKSASTRDTISKGGYRTDAEPMESRGPKFNGTAK